MSMAIKVGKRTRVPEAEYTFTCYDRVLKHYMPKEKLLVRAGKEVRRTIRIDRVLRKVRIETVLPEEARVSRAYLLVKSGKKAILSGDFDKPPITTMWLADGEYSLFLQIFGFHDVDKTFFVDTRDKHELHLKVCATYR